eukprot:442577_1
MAGNKATSQRERIRNPDSSTHISQSHNDLNDCIPSDYTKCMSMKRLLTEFKRYSMLQTEPNDDTLTRFMTEYTRLIDDYIHFKETHEHQLQQIHEELTKSEQFSDCDINKCQFTARHQRKHTIKPIVMDEKLNVYTETFDGLHFHLLHSFDVGLRTKQSQDAEEMSEMNDRYYDPVFARINQIVLATHHLTTSFPRFSSKNKKFSIPNVQPKEISRNHTYLDQLMMMLLKSNIDPADIEKLAQFIKEEQYVSEAIDFDYEFNPNNNFSRKYVANRTIVTQWHSFIKGLQLQWQLECSSFNIGYRFYYWPKYKHLKEIRLDSYNTCYNTWNHSGYYCFELFIESKYRSFKEEILFPMNHANYNLSLAQYEKVIVKVKAYLQVSEFKKTSATVSQYEIKENDPIQSDHLLALTLYTDYGNLCTDFSSTFRKQNSYETMDAVKERNSVYYWMSRRLRECVEVFGQFNGHD